MMKIEKIFYKKIAQQYKEYRKIILEQIDKYHFLRKEYVKVDDIWQDAMCTSNYDGELHNGIIQYVSDTVAIRFDLLIKYEHYKLISDTTITPEPLTDLSVDDICQQIREWAMSAPVSMTDLPVVKICQQIREWAAKSC